MKAYAIDPVMKQVTETEYNADWRTIKNHCHCDTFDIVRLNETDAVYVDDEGLINGAVQRYGTFMLTQTDNAPGSEPNRVLLAGYGFVLGSDEDGESTAPSMSLADLQAMVSFPTPDEIRELAAGNKL